MNRAGLLVLLFVVFGNSASAQGTLPPVEGLDAGDLQRQCKQLLQSLAKLKAPLLEKSEQEIRAFIAEKKNAQEKTEEIQKLLNAQCLVGVSINPESRVKAARGPRSADLIAGKETIFLIRVLNEAGVTHPLSVNLADSARENWLEITVHPETASEKKLSGQKLEYVPVRLKAQKPGKREATLVFDVGQGTQDLGFRAEVPILFTVKGE
jgi:hypothetical protein